MSAACLASDELITWIPVDEVPLCKSAAVYAVIVVVVVVVVGGGGGVFSFS